MNKETKKSLISFFSFLNKRPKIALKVWQNTILKKQKKLMEQARKSREKCIQSILMFRHVYAIEDDSGEYDVQRLSTMSDEELLELLEELVDELKKDVGE